MSDAHGDEARTGRRVTATWVAVGVAGLVVVALAVPRLLGADAVGEGPTPLASAPSITEPVATATPTPSPSPSPTPTATPTPTETPTEAPTETVLFQGGPATGPWQQLGTVAEITHPDAPASARYSYTNFWSDPAEENQPDELWDQLVIEVTEQLVELGEPVDRPAFGAAEGSEAFNASGGLKDFYPAEGVFTGSWQAVFEDRDGVALAFFGYLVDFESGEVLASNGPLVLRDDGTRSFEDNTAESFAWLREWAATEGYRECERCS